MCILYLYINYLILSIYCPKTNIILFYSKESKFNYFLKEIIFNNFINNNFIEIIAFGSFFLTLGLILLIIDRWTFIFKIFIIYEIIFFSYLIYFFFLLNQLESFDLIIYCLILICLAAIEIIFALALLIIKVKKQTYNLNLYFRKNK